MQLTFLKNKEKVDYIVSVPTTSPLRKISDIDNCIKTATQKKIRYSFYSHKIG